MMNKVKTWLSIVAIAVLIGFAFGPQIADAVGHIGLRNVTQPLRTKEVTYTLWTPDTGNNTTDIIAGQGGVVASKYFPAGSNTITMTETSTNVVAPPYPCKLRIYVKDGDNDAGDALTCTGAITICGYNQFGQLANQRDTATGCEVLTADITEGTEIATERVYERVTSISAAGCSGNGTPDTNNLLSVGCSTAIGLPLPVDNFTGVVTVCIVEDTDALQCFDAADMAAADVDLDDEALILNDAGDYTATGLGETDDGADVDVDDSDVVTIRVRYPAGF